MCDYEILRAFSHCAAAAVSGIAGYMGVKSRMIFEEFYLSN